MVYNSYRNASYYQFKLNPFDGDNINFSIEILQNKRMTLPMETYPVDTEFISGFMKPNHAENEFSVPVFICDVGIVYTNRFIINLLFVNNLYTCN